MNKIIFSILGIIALYGLYGVININKINAHASDIANEVQSPVVMELFTSQSCSSCPSADKLLSDLAQANDNIIALSCNVTYWNHLHWEDTLSKEFCNIRQRQYVHALQSRGPYTPQIIINGNDETVGSQAGKIKFILSKQNKLENVSLLIDEEKNLKVSLQNMDEGIYQILLIPYADDVTQSIPKGENRGRTVHYTNPIIKVIDLGKWDGTARDINYDLSNVQNIKGAALLIHKNSSVGNIVAAGKAEI